MDYFLGQIKIFGGNYAPQDWHVCDGSTVSVQTYQELFALIGTTYGGDGVNTFGLPDLRGRIVVGMQASQADYALGKKGGLESVTLTEANLPQHTHTLSANTNNATASALTGNILAAPVDPKGSGREVLTYIPKSAPGFKLKPLNRETISNTGGSQAHENRMPYLTLNYIICLTGGLFPTPN
ncbi:MAG: tail fiber protein [Mucilaginibacter sp.]